MATLKVYRTPIGFHDAYVAAPSQKAALAAWGTTTNLFARGVAEVVDDPALTAEPLAHPGEVIRRTRGGLAEQLAALPPDTPARRAKQTPTAPAPAARAAKPKPKPKPKPRPSRAALDKADAALAAAEARHAEEAAALAAEEAALAKRRRAMADAQAKEHARLDAAAERARSAYEAALERWRAD